MKLRKKDNFRTKNTKNNIAEYSLYEKWLIFCNAGLITSDGRLRGIYAGKLDTFNGPDFQGAEIELNGKIYRGDVEIHLYVKDWYLHGHDLDSRYDRVILHLVWFLAPDDETTVTNSKGLAIPTLSIRRLPSAADKHLTVRCFFPRSQPDNITASLKDLALRRLLIKAHQFDLSINKYGHEQALYTTFMHILGTPQNRQNFERLSQIISWHDIQRFKQKYHFSIENWLALYYLQSGLIKKNIIFKPLQRYGDNIRPLMTKCAMSDKSWKLAGQRPNNSPISRLLGLSHFLHHLPSLSLCAIFKDIMTARLDFKDLYRALIEILTVNPSQFYHKYGFSSLKLWGNSLITEIIGNVIIPFFYREAISYLSFGYATYLEEFYLYLPATNSYGRLKYYYDWPEIKNCAIKQFYLNQALLHLSLNYCEPKTCKNCPMGCIPEIH